MSEMKKREKKITEEMYGLIKPLADAFAAQREKYKHVTEYEMAGADFVNRMMAPHGIKISRHTYKRIEKSSSFHNYEEIVRSGKPSCRKKPAEVIQMPMPIEAAQMTMDSLPNEMIEPVRIAKIEVAGMDELMAGMKAAMEKFFAVMDGISAQIHETDRKMARLANAWDPENDHNNEA